MRSAKETLEIMNIFREREPNPRCELNYVNAYTLLVAVVLSAQSTDKGVNKATEGLFKIVDTPQKMLNLGLEKLKTYLDMTKGTTIVYLEVPSKENPQKIHRIKTGKRILLHKGLLEYIENTMGNAWSFK